MRVRRYSELIRLPSFEDRYDYLRLQGEVGSPTFGLNRYMNQILYSSKEWKRIRDKVIIRDNGCDLAHPDFEINDRIYIHHLNPITLDQLEHSDGSIFDMENLICTSFDTHQAIHFGDSTLLPKLPIVRMPNDTCPWK